MASSVTAVQATGTANTSSPFDQSVSVAVASGDTRAIAIVHQVDDTTDPIRTISSITFNSSAMTEVTGSPFLYSTDREFRAYYYDISALSPGNYTCEVRYSGGLPGDCVLACYVCASAGNPSGWVEDSDSTTTVDIAITTESGGVAIWAIFQDGDTDVTPNGGETEAYDNLYRSPAGWYLSSGYYKATSGTTTTSNLAIANSGWAGIGLFVPNASATQSNAPRVVHLMSMMGA